MDPEVVRIIDNFQEADLIERDESFLKSYVELASNDIAESLKSIFENVAKTWLESGLPDEERAKLHHDFSAKIVDIANEFQNKQTDNLKSLYDFREYTLIEVNKILNDLTLPEYVQDLNKPLLSQCKLLKIKKSELEAVKLERSSQLDMIVQKWKRIRSHLGEEWEEPKFQTNIPAEFELTMARSNMVNQEETYKKRKLKFNQLKKEIIAVGKEVEFTYEEYPFINSEDTIYSTELMNQIESLKTKVQTLHNQFMNEKQRKIEQLEKLFERLKLENNLQYSILNKKHESLVKQNHFLDKEIEKYELIKLSMIKDITLDVRDKVSEILQYCRASKFPLPSFFHDQDDFTEPKLIQHETFLEHLQTYAETFEPIFTQLVNYEETVAKALDLEMKIHDPNKYKNRGGTLLTNERDHRQLKKRLENMEREIINATLKAEGISFSQYGFEIHQYFTDKRQEYEDAVENVKASYGIKSKTNSNDRLVLPKTGSTKKLQLPQVRSVFKTKPVVANTIAKRVVSQPQQKTETSELAFKRNLMAREVDKNFLQSTMLEPSPVYSSGSKILPARTGTPGASVFNAASVTKRRRVSRSVERTTPKSNRRLFYDDQEERIPRRH